MTGSRSQFLKKLNSPGESVFCGLSCTCAHARSCKIVEFIGSYLPFFISSIWCLF